MKTSNCVFVGACAAGPSHDATVMLPDPPGACARTRSPPVFGAVAVSDVGIATSSVFGEETCSELLNNEWFSYYNDFYSIFYLFIDTLIFLSYFEKQGNEAVLEF